MSSVCLAILLRRRSGEPMRMFVDLFHSCRYFQYKLNLLDLFETPEVFANKNTSFKCIIIFNSMGFIYSDSILRFLNTVSLECWLDDYTKSTEWLQTTQQVYQCNWRDNLDVTAAERSNSDCGYHQIVYIKMPARYLTGCRDYGALLHHLEATSGNNMIRSVHSLSSSVS